MADLEDKIAIVTGGAGGLGSATARALAAEGARVMVTDIDEAGGQAIADEVDGAFLRVDVSSPEENREMFDSTVERFGGLDHVFLNAGISSGIGVGADFDVETYRRVMGINLDGVVFGAHEALRVLGEHGGGSVVATASLAGLTAVPYDPLYAANKHAVVGLMRSLGFEGAIEGIRFNAICPGFSESGIIAPFRHMLVESGMPIIPAEKVADAVVSLFTGEMSGEAWFVQPGIDAQNFRFRNIPGPRAE